MTGWPDLRSPSSAASWWRRWPSWRPARRRRPTWSSTGPTWAGPGARAGAVARAHPVLAAGRRGRRRRSSTWSRSCRRAARWWWPRATTAVREPAPAARGRTWCTPGSWSTCCPGVALTRGFVGVGRVIGPRRRPKVSQAVLRFVPGWSRASPARRSQPCATPTRPTTIRPSRPQPPHRLRRVRHAAHADLRRLPRDLHLLPRGPTRPWSSTWPRSGDAAAVRRRARPRAAPRATDGLTSVCRRRRPVAARAVAPPPWPRCPTPRRAVALVRHLRAAALVPSVDEVLAVGRRRASTRWASPRRRRSPRPAATSNDARRPASTAAWRSRTGSPSARPTRAGRCPTPPPSWSAPAAYRRRRRRPAAAGRPRSPSSGRKGPSGRRAGWPATPGRTTTAPLRAALDGRGQARSRPTAGGPGCSPTTTPSSTARPPTGPASAGTGRTPTCCCPGAGSWFVLGAVVTDAPARRRPPEPVADGCGTCTPLPRRRARPAPSSRPAWSTPAAAWPGWSRRGAVPRRAPRRARRPPLRLRRLPGGVPAQPRGPPRHAAAPPAGAGRRADGSTCSTCWPRPTTSCWPATAAGTCRAARPATCAATRSSCSATSATPRRPGRGRALVTALAHDDPLVRGHAVWAARRLGRDDLLAAVGRRSRPAVRAEVAADVPPRSVGLDARATAGTSTGGRRRHRRRRRALRSPSRWATCSSPTTSRPSWAASSPTCGSCGGGSTPADVTVLTTPHPDAAAWDAEQPLPRRPHARAGAAADAVAGPAHRRARRRGRRRPGRCSTPPCRSGLLGPRLRPALRRWCCTAPRSPCPAGCPAAGRCWRHVLRGAARSSPPAATRRPRPSGPPAGRCRSPWSSRRASTPSASARSTPSERAKARGPLRPARTTPGSCVGLSRLVPRKGMDVLIRAAARLAARPARPASSRSAAAGRDRRPARRGWSPRPGAPVALLGPGRRGGQARPLRLRRRLRHAVPQPLGRARAGGLRHRVPRGGGGRRPGGGRRQRRGRRGGRATARPASSCATHRRRRGGRGARRPARRPRAPGRRWARPPAAGRPPSCPTRARRPRRPRRSTGGEAPTCRRPDSCPRRPPTRPTRADGPGSPRVDADSTGPSGDVDAAPVSRPAMTDEGDAGRPGSDGAVRRLPTADGTRRRRGPADDGRRTRGQAAAAGAGDGADDDGRGRRTWATPGSDETATSAAPTTPPADRSTAERNRPGAGDGAWQPVRRRRARRHGTPTGAPADRPVAADPPAGIRPRPGAPASVGAPRRRPRAIARPTPDGGDATSGSRAGACGRAGRASLRPRRRSTSRAATTWARATGSSGPTCGPPPSSPWSAPWRPPSRRLRRGLRRHLSLCSLGRLRRRSSGRFLTGVGRSRNEVGPLGGLFFLGRRLAPARVRRRSVSSAVQVVVAVVVA